MDTPSTPPSESRPDIACHAHPEYPGIAWCSRCKQPLCHYCFQHDLRGLCVCASCATQKIESGTPWDDPSQPSNLGAFADTLFDAIRSPQTFWKEISPRASSLPALCFALICIFAGVAMNYAWLFILEPETMQRVREGLELRFPEQLFKIFIFMRAILITPIHFFIHVVLLHYLVNSFGSGTRVHYHLTTRIAGYSSAAYVLFFIPPINGFPLGQICAFFWLYFLEYYALRRYLEVSNLRANFITLLAILGAFTLAGI